MRSGIIECMQVHDQLARMDAQQLREFAANLIETVVSKDRELQYKQLKIEQLTHEMALLKRWKFAARSEQLHGAQRSLLDETIDADLEAIATELATLRSPERTLPAKDQPKRSPLPAHLPRIEVHHEPEQTVCGCGCAMTRRTGRISGAIARRNSMPCTPSFTTLQRAAPRRIPDNFSKAGQASSSAMTMRATRACSLRESPRLAALRMRAGNSTICGSTTRAQWLRKR
jgi:hypothetical protein